MLLIKTEIICSSNVNHNVAQCVCVCVASTCLHTLPTISGYASTETDNIVLVDLTDLQGISELLDCLLAALDALTHNISEVLNWIQVWGTQGPVTDICVFIICEVFTYFGVGEYMESMLVNTWRACGPRY